MTEQRKLRYAMVGGGPGAFIGDVHRKAALFDGQMDLVAGVFSSNPEKSQAQGRALFLSPDRVYGNFQEMAEAEAGVAAADRLDFVAIVTPNHTHFEIAKAFIEAGFHVICDKPMTNTLEEAEELCQLVARHDVVFALTHNYTGYPLVKEAKRLVRKGALGQIRKIVVEYPQGWLANPIELEGQKQAAWRTDPQRAGVSSCIGDIGSHAENLVHYVTGLEMAEICADLTTFVPGRRLEDDGSVLVRYEGGAKGILYASQISVGEENNLRLRVYGTEAGIDWRQENPNELVVRHLDAPEEVMRRGNAYLGPWATAATRLPSGHPEGFYEAFANIYRNFGSTVQARLSGETPSEIDLDFPTVQDGARGVHFIHTAVESSEAGGWVDARYRPPGV